MKRRSKEEMIEVRSWRFLLLQHVLPPVVRQKLLQLLLLQLVEVLRRRELPFSNLLGVFHERAMNHIAALRVSLHELRFELPQQTHQLLENNELAVHQVARADAVDGDLKLRRHYPRRLPRHRLQKQERASGVLQRLSLIDDNLNVPQRLPLHSISSELRPGLRGQPEVAHHQYSGLADALYPVDHR